MTTSYADVWQAERPRLTALAYRVLGSWHDAEDVVAQSWLRLADQHDLDRPQAWLTTAVTRLAIDAGRRARARRETYPGTWLPEPVATDRLPEDAAQAGSLLGLAMLRLMDALDPEERAIFVLREAFDVPYAEIASCVGRSPAACRQVVSRTRARLAASGPTGAAAGPDDGRLLTALVAAVQEGDIADVVRLVSEDCVLWADGGGVVSAARRPVVGSDKVIRFLAGVAGNELHGVEVLDVNGAPAVLFHAAAGSYLYVVERVGGRVTGIQVHANPAKLAFAR